MADGRFVSKAIGQNDQLARVSLEAALLFTWCIPHLDVEGRMTGNPQLVHAKVCPLRPEITVLRVPELVSELAHQGLIVWYAVSGRQYLFFPGFEQHQKGLRKDKEAPSRIPGPEDAAARLIGGADQAQLILTPAVSVTPDLRRTSDGLSPSRSAEVEVEVEGEEKLKGREVRPGATAADVVFQCLAGDGRSAFEGYYRAARHPGALAGAVLAESPEGIHGRAGQTWAVVGQALADMRASGKEFTPVILRAFCRRLLAADSAPTAGEPVRILRDRAVEMFRAAGVTPPDKLPDYFASVSAVERAIQRARQRAAS